MSLKNAKLRPALGQVASIGTLYDAVNDRFLEQRLFTARFQPHANIVGVRTTPRQLNAVELIADTYGSKLKLLGASADLGASMLGDLLELDDSGSDSAAFLTRPAAGDHADAQAALLHRSLTTSEYIKVKSQELRCSIDRDQLRDRTATHAVVSIEWGIETIVNIDLSNGQDAEDRTTAAETVRKVAESLKSLITTGSTQRPLMPTLATGQTLDFTIYSNVLPSVVKTNSLDDAVKSVRQAIAVAESPPQGLDSGFQQGQPSRGLPVIYRLLPLDDLRDLVGTDADEAEDGYCDYDGFEYAFVGPKVVEISHDRLAEMSVALENLLATRRSLVGYKTFLDTHSQYAQTSHVSAVRTLVNELEESVGSLRRKYGSVLCEVRAGREPTTTLNRFCDDAVVTAAQFHSRDDIVAQERYKVEFIARAVQKGAVYLGYDKNVELPSVLARNNRSDGEAYVLWFSLEGMLQNDGWAGNEALVFEKLGARSRVFLIDCSTSGRRVDAPRLALYRGKEEATPDILEEREFLADKCLAQSAERSSYTRNAQPPVARRVVRIPCPGPRCGGAGVQSWICSFCHHVLEYGYTDKFIYCECGRSLFNTFEFRCNNPTRHGTGFVKYSEQSQLEALLLALPSSDYVNILLLGETGVGKSTFINAFINYISFDTLDEALQSDRLHWVVPCAFSTQVMDRTRPGGKITEHRVVVGSRDDERDGSRGNSATQQTSVYPINIGAKTIRLIDTPGVGDTRGPNADKKNMADILATINSYEELHGIIILLKSNNARLTVTFRFCIQELLTHLHRDALHNIAFGFTNTRISNYTPGDTFGPLKTLLEQHPDIQLPLNGDTTYCFDSESFRYLAARRNGVEMENEDSFRRSWLHSSDEAQRLLNYFRSRRPHLVTNTISLNGTRQLILGLTKPMAAISQLIQENIIKSQAQEKAIADRRLAGDDLRKRLQFQKVYFSSTQLSRPRTVCTNRNCIEVKDNGGQQVTVYKSHCHPECYLSGVRVEAVGQPGLINCKAMKAGNCKRCGHHWQMHLHITYELNPYTKTETNPDVQRQLNSNADDERVRQQALDSIKQQIAEFRQEHDRVQRAAALFGAYLRAKSIATYNDATAEYLEELIQVETEVSAASGDTTKLKMLRHDLHCHKELVAALTTNTDELPNDWHGVDTTLDPASIERTVKGLYGLKHFGKQLQDVHHTVQQAHQATYRERPYHVKQRSRRTGTSPTRDPPTKGSSKHYTSIGTTLRSMIPSMPRFGSSSSSGAGAATTSHRVGVDKGAYGMKSTTRVSIRT
ncbi:hypothetical protein MMYC01_200171 [Madurella mycetomatis]|uniref:G domain-containing protein n=1 Tax=Madurella mycetomatis TaxID=100816 RepID=A0A175VY15_9PEZI|nr:hypothetical protein MMYC01_206797 [Madurella mycetomatis]KXX83181.1 hypothetical protein MMYC01_200171 [Madurella mycetomatis]